MRVRFLCSKGVNALGAPSSCCIWSCQNLLWWPYSVAQIVIEAALEGASGRVARYAKSLQTMFFVTVFLFVCFISRSLRPVGYVQSSNLQVIGC